MSFIMLQIKFAANSIFSMFWIKFCKFTFCRVTKFKISTSCKIFYFWRIILLCMTTMILRIQINLKKRFKWGYTLLTAKYFRNIKSKISRTLPGDSLIWHLDWKKNRNLKNFSIFYRSRWKKYLQKMKSFSKMCWSYSAYVQLNFLLKNKKLIFSRLRSNLLPSRCSKKRILALLITVFRL